MAKTILEKRRVVGLEEVCPSRPWTKNMTVIWHLIDEVLAQCLAPPFQKWVQSGVWWARQGQRRQNGRVGGFEALECLCRLKNILMSTINNLQHGASSQRNGLWPQQLSCFLGGKETVGLVSEMAWIAVPRLELWVRALKVRCLCSSAESCCMSLANSATHCVLETGVL